MTGSFNKNRGLLTLMAAYGMMSVPQVEIHAPASKVQPTRSKIKDERAMAKAEEKRRRRAAKRAVLERRVK